MGDKNIMTKKQIPLSFGKSQAESKNSEPKPENRDKGLAFGGVTIREDKDGGMISLTDLWKAAGKPKNQQPAQWLRLPGTERLTEALKKQIVGLSLNLIKSRGRLGTFAHWQLALAYAKYLSPELHLHVNEIYMRYRSGDVTLAEEILDKAAEENMELSVKQALSTLNRNEFIGILKCHEVCGFGFAQCTNCTYKGIWDRTAAQIRKNKKLPAKANLRKNMGTDELVTVMFAEMLAKNDIKKRDVRGNTPCADACFQNALKVRKVIGD